MTNAEQLEIYHCFKAYDIRGRMPLELNAEIVRRIGCAYAEFLKPQRVVIGRDIRMSSGELSDALCDGLRSAGVDVYDLGLCGTEEVYFATFSQQMDGGVMITASHNPQDYNGLKLVAADARPISDDSGLRQIRSLAQCGQFKESKRHGQRLELDVRNDYIAHLLNYVEIGDLPALKVVVNAGNGCAGPIIDALAPYLPCEFIRLHHQPDGQFPNGVPNPLLPENRRSTSEAVVRYGADLGIAWDGDFDRCFFFDHQGNFVDSYYVISLLAQSFLTKYPGETIVHDPRLCWNTTEVIAAHGGQVVQSRPGHSFMKQTMRDVDAVYGGEVSAHHFFRDFSYCDSGMIPWLLVLELMGRSGRTLASLVAERQLCFPVSGEINVAIDRAPQCLEQFEYEYSKQAVSVEHCDGLSLEFENWRLNLRCSNTEPLVRLNIETRNDSELLKEKTAEILRWLEAWKHD